jgi:ABC-type uncharacterized transport system involved in gliding motility auxiliary subunit
MLAIVIRCQCHHRVSPVRVDLTQEKAYTLSAGTRAVLKKLDTPVTIHFYCTQSDTATPETVYLKATRARSRTCCRNTSRSPARI